MTHESHGEHAPEGAVLTPPRAEPHRERHIVALIEPIRRVARARLRDPEAIEDVVQETLSRVLATRERLDEGALLPYAVVTARTVAADVGRDRQRDVRHAHRLIDRLPAESPEEAAVRREEEAALSAALAALPPEDRRLLVEHEVGGAGTAELAASSGASAGGVAARLARVRAKLRVDFLLALRRIELPTTRCRPVLLALSMGDRRRQHVLRAGAHLATCRVCTELSRPLVERERALAGVGPIAWLAASAIWLTRLFRDRKVQATTATAAVLAAGVTAVAVANRDDSALPARTATPSASEPPTPSLARLTGRVVTRSGVAVTEARLASLAGQVIEARGVVVTAVPADEGFWISDGAGGRIWVAIRTTGESGRAVRPGQRLSFRGSVARNPPGYARAVGVTPAEGAAALERAGAHVETSSLGS